LSLSETFGIPVNSTVDGMYEIPSMVSHSPSVRRFVWAFLPLGIGGAGGDELSVDIEILRVMRSIEKCSLA